VRLALKLLALAVAGLGSLTWLTFEIGGLAGAAGPLSKTYAVEAEFADATGLFAGDEVRMAGVRIGRVEEIAVEAGTAVVAIAVDRSIELPAEVRLELRWQDLLGRRFIQAVPPRREGLPTLAGPALEAGSRIPGDRTRSAADLGALLDGLDPTLRTLDTDGMNRVMTALAAVLEDRDREVAHAISSSAELTTRLRGRADVMGETLGQLATVVDTVARRDQQVEALLTELADASTSMSGQAAGLGDAIADGGEMAALLEEVLAANDEDLDAILDQLSTVTGTIAERDEELSEGLRTLAWTSAALIRATNHGDWLQVYGRGFGVVNTYYPEPRVGPDTGDVGPDDTEGPAPLLDQPHLLEDTELPDERLGPLRVGPGEDEDGDEEASPGDRLQDPLGAPMRGGGR
jgi:phospholipid/cholesterol/gamma-HCH transport system substrate-binding protein